MHKNLGTKYNIYFSLTFFIEILKESLLNFNTFKMINEKMLKNWNII